MLHFACVNKYHSVVLQGLEKVGRDKDKMKSWWWVPIGKGKNQTHGLRKMPLTFLSLAILFWTGLKNMWHGILELMKERSIVLQFIAL